MMKETVKIFNRLHHPDHTDELTMINELAGLQGRIDSRMLKCYLYGYLQCCDECQKRWVKFSKPRSERYCRNIYIRIDRMRDELEGESYYEYVLRKYGDNNGVPLINMQTIKRFQINQHYNAIISN